MTEHTVMQAAGYDRIDGRNAYKSNIKKLTLGKPVLEENQNMEIALQIWRTDKEGRAEMQTELPIHQVMDLMIFLGRTMAYFKEAYRIPGLYDAEKPIIDRVGLQGDAMQVEVCVDNSDLDKDIQAFTNSLSGLGELTGERLQVLARILESLEYC